MELNPRYLLRDTDRHGNPRIYVRRRGVKIRIREPVGSPTFHIAYARAVERLDRIDAPRDEKSPRAFPRGTLGWLGAQYLASPEFQAMEPISQFEARRILESCFREPISETDPEPMGNCPLQHFTSQAAKRLRDLKAGAKAAANNRRKHLVTMFNWAIEQTPPLATSNPARDIRRIKYKTDGFHTWTDAEISSFERRHPIGTKARLALALLMFTGARRSDVVRLGPANVTDGWLCFVPQKTRKKRPDATPKPWLPVLADIVARSQCGSVTFLATPAGAPYTPKGFGNWFFDRCREAGISACSAHGLRKVGAVKAAEGGATVNQLMAIFDWLSPQMAILYTEKANRKRMTGEAMGLLAGGSPVPPGRGTVPRLKIIQKNQW